MNQDYLSSDNINITHNILFSVLKMSYKLKNIK